MQPSVGESPKNPELVPFNVIRVETAISRYPVHRLARQGTINIEIREKSENGDVLIQWVVSHNSRFGQPGPMAYKLDTLIVNRRIEEATRPIPKIIKLGTLRDVCHELGISKGENLNMVKRALHQNASAYITARLRYTLADGCKKELEAGFTRYQVVFTGEELPDGRKADAVYLVLSDLFMQVINGAQTRPLDYDYLRDLPPASQRLYELLSFRMYPALKHGRRQARLAYSEFCTYAPLTRFLKWDQVRPQMARIHRPHLKSGYIESVEFEQTAERDGNPDWLMVYVPGPKAKTEFRTFTKRGGSRTLEIEPPSPALPSPAEAGATLFERELINRGVTASTARELVATYPEERIAAQIDYFDWLREKEPKKVQASPGGYLTSAIRGDYASPNGFESKAQRAKHEETERERKHQEAAANRRRQEQKTREDYAQAKIAGYIKDLSPDDLSRLDTEAIEQADPETREGYDRQHPSFRAIFLRSIREMHIRKLLKLPSSPED